MQAEVEDALATVLRLADVRSPAPADRRRGCTPAARWCTSTCRHRRTTGDAHALGRGWPGAAARHRGPRRRVAAPGGSTPGSPPLWRRYAYRVSDHPFGPEPLRRHDVLAHRRRLDDAAMDEAARRCSGEHDFAAFCRRREGATTVRTLIERDAGPRPGRAARRPGRRRRLLPQHGALASSGVLRRRRGPARSDLAGQVLAGRRAAAGRLGGAGPRADPRGGPSPHRRRARRRGLRATRRKREEPA